MKLPPKRPNCVLPCQHGHPCTTMASFFCSLSLHHLLQGRRYLFGLLSFLLLIILACNGASIFCLPLSFPAEVVPLGPASFLPENVVRISIPKEWQSASPKQLMHSVKKENPSPILQKSHQVVEISISKEKQSASTKQLMHSIKQENPSPILQKSHQVVEISISKEKQSASTKQLMMHSVKKENPSPILQKSHQVVVSRWKRRQKNKMAFKRLHSDFQTVEFSKRVNEFFTANSCGVRFFMTWISSSLESFGEREVFAVQSLFKSHPNGCLVIVSTSMDSKGGRNVLEPFSSNGFHVMAISPDFGFLFKSTPAESWIHRLRSGEVDPGEVSLGQNLSNLLRLALLYKFGGAYIDTDVIILKSFTNLRNAIGAQSVDPETGNWTRLNNAVMLFDKGHPLLLKFIEEFATTFNGNKWGYNGPYLVSRVVENLQVSDRSDVNILKPIAFYPLDWSRIRSLFEGPKNEAHAKRLRGKLNYIHSQSYALHLWNSHSKNIKIEEQSIIAKIISDCCVFCNSSSPGW